MTQPALKTDHAKAPARSAFSARALVAGTTGSLLIAFGCPYATFILRGSYVDLDFSTPGAIFLLFILTGLVNNWLARISRGWALTAGECITVYIMMIVASAVQTMGLSGQLMSIITAPYSRRAMRWPSATSWGGCRWTGLCRGISKPGQPQPVPRALAPNLSPSRLQPRPIITK